MELVVSPCAMDWLSNTTPKQRHAGTVRARAPRETLALLEPQLKELGITRLANVTGLDRVGIPVAQAVRPNARSLAVSQGTGIDDVAAKVSALMHSLALFHAEDPQIDLRIGTLFDMATREHTVDLDRVPRAFRDPYPQLRSLWTRGVELFSAKPIWVPFGLVTMDLTMPLLEGSEVYPPSSNGLAAGNALSEAMLHALCQLIERDAYTLFFLRSREARRALRIDPSSVRDPICSRLLAALLAANLRVELWNITSDIGVPTFLCALLENEHVASRYVGLAFGSGTHLDPGIALSRALTEAARTRLTRITGSCDSVLPETDASLQSAAAREAHLRYFDSEVGTYPHREQPVFDGTTFEDDIRFVLERLRSSGIEQVAAVDLSRAGWPVSVVRAIVPGLEALLDAPSYRPGVRAQRIATVTP